MAYSGFTGSTSKHLQLDAGAFLKNYDVTTDTWETAKLTKLIGATQGGGNFSAVPEVRAIEIDGVKGAVKGLEAIDGWTVTLTANVKEVTAESLQMALGCATIGATLTTAPIGYRKIEAHNYFADADYLNNITWVGKISGAEAPVIIVLKNALCKNGLNLTMADKAEGLVTITFTGHYDASDLDSAPFEIYYPTISTT